MGLKYRDSLSPLGVFVLIVLISPHAASAKQAPAPNPEGCNLTAEELEVYSETIQEVLLKDQDDTARVIVRERTSDGYPPGLASMKSHRGETKELLNSLHVGTRDQFDAQNKTSCILDPHIRPTGRIQLLSAREEQASFPKGGGSWKEFYKKYPGATGFTLLSRIGFSSKRNEAMVYLGNSCGLLCGNGYLVVLDKHKGKWKVVQQAHIWVAE